MISPASYSAEDSLRIDLVLGAFTRAFDDARVASLWPWMTLYTDTACDILDERGGGNLGYVE